MKKFIYSFAVIAALGLVACGGNKNEEAATEEPVEVEAVEVEAAEVADSACCAGDSCVAVAEEVVEAPAAE